MAVGDPRPGVGTANGLGSLVEHVERGIVVTLGGARVLLCGRMSGISWRRIRSESLLALGDVGMVAGADGRGVIGEEVLGICQSSSVM